MRIVLIVAALCILLAGCGEDGLEGLGRLEDVALDDAEGRPFRLSELDADRERIEREVREVAAEFGLTPAMGTGTELASLPGLRKDGALDPLAKWRLLSRAGAPFGRAAAPDDLSAIETVADAIDWIERLNGTPVVLMTWASRCRTCPQMHGRILETLGSIDARLFAVASSPFETPATIAAYRTTHEFNLRVLADSDGQVAAALGADRTPTFAVLDADLRVRYRGGLDDDPRGAKNLAERRGYVADAVAAVSAGRAVAVPETRGVG